MLMLRPGLNSIDSHTIAPLLPHIRTRVHKIFRVTLNKSMCKICQFIPEDGIATNALWERSIDSRAVD